MNRAELFRWGSGLIVVGALALPALADEPGEGHKHHKPILEPPHDIQKAGYPRCISPLAHPSYNQHYTGGWIGGGKAIGGDEPCLHHEGTWGWDYTPLRPGSPRIFLGWSHGRHYQGGTGAYRTDGPKPIERFRERLHGEGPGEPPPLPN